TRFPYTTLFRSLGAIGTHLDDILLETFPGIARGPGAIQHSLGRSQVVRAPVVDDGGELGFGSKGAHVSALAEATHDTALGGNLQGGRTVRVLGNHVDALVDHGTGSVGFLG